MRIIIAKFMIRILAFFSVLLLFVETKTINNNYYYYWNDIAEIENLVQQWAPLIWLSNEEKFMPINVEDFLKNTNIADENGKILIKNAHLAHHRYYIYNSKKYFLIPNQSLDNLKFNTSSFIYGKNPKIYSHQIPVYAVITHCKKSLKYYFHVTYWMFYPYNEGKDACFLGKVPAPLIFSKCFGHFRKLGNHLGDWEHVSYLFQGNSYPEKIFLSVHDAGAYYNYDIERRIFKFDQKMKRKGVAQIPIFPQYVRMQGGHPVLFAAEGSHGLWSAPGEHEFIRVPKILDKTGFGTPWKTWSKIYFHHIGLNAPPLWMNFKGKWGNPKRKCVLLLKKFGLCEYTDGPVGLLRDNQDFYC